MIDKEKLLEELQYIKESGSYGVMFLDLSQLIDQIKRGKYESNVGYTLLVAKDHRYETDMVLRKVKQLLYGLDDYKGKLKIVIEVIEDEI